jgi:hypothetical protein
MRRRNMASSEGKNLPNKVHDRDHGSLRAVKWLCWHDPCGGGDVTGALSMTFYFCRVYLLQG